jgi:hypothetical protein
MDQLACCGTRLEEEDAFKGLRCSSGSYRMLIYASSNVNEPDLLESSPVEPIEAGSSGVVASAARCRYHLTLMHVCVIPRD